MRRRQFILVLLGAAFWPRIARAQRAAPAQPAPAADDSIGQVSTVQGSATVTRANATPIALKVSDPIFKGDTLATGANGLLGVTFDDESTFSLSENARIVVDEFVYEEGASGNRGAINVARGTVAFVAAQVAKTGTLTVTTPTASLGIRGTTGVIDVPENATAGGEAKVKLYPDADGRVGHIDVFDRQGGRLGSLTQGSSAFAIRPGAGGRFAAVPFRIPPQEAARDRGVVQRLFASHNIGRRLAVQRRQLRQRNQRRRGGPQRPNRGQQQPNRGRGREQQRGGLRERLRNLNPLRRQRQIPPDQR